jgi:hypothetical protein
LYHPGDAVLPSVGGFFKNTPIVAASDPNALEILEANPNQLKHQLLLFYLRQLFLLILRIQFDFFTFCASICVMSNK